MTQRVFNDLADNPTALPVRTQSFMDWTREKGRRMCWQFFYADGSSLATFDTRKALRLKNRMMIAGLIRG